MGGLPQCRTARCFFSCKGTGESPRTNAEQAIRGLGADSNVAAPDKTGLPQSAALVPRKGGRSGWIASIRRWAVVSRKDGERSVALQQFPGLKKALSYAGF